MCVGDSSQNQWIVSWSYWRDNNARSGISAQNVKMDGNLGPLAIEDPSTLLNLPKFSVYPNPVGQTADIHYKLDVPAHISVSLYDPRGQFIEKIHDQLESAGDHSVLFNRNDNPPGVYILKMQTGSTICHLKIVLL
jgi:hypothetical protein